MDYAEFIASKRRVDPATGLDDVGELPDFLFDFQRDITRWALRRGRAAIFAGTGLGKTAMELVWGDTIHKRTGLDLIYFAPLAVTAQIIREASKFGVSARHVHTQDECGPGINVTNYQKLEHFDMSKFGGVILDESSILKNVDGHYRNRLTEACGRMPFRLAATATPAPNDFMELGTTAEFLGVMSYTDMLATFFVHDGSETQKWRLKGHAENDFWKWMASWSVMIRMPSDLGYDDGAFKLPPLLQRQHVVSVNDGPDMETGTLFQFEARTMKERLQARRSSVAERVAKASEITRKSSDEPFVWWCNLNSESEALTKSIPGAVEVRGSDSEESKERKLIDFSEGKIRVLVTKPSICGYGMNWQHCANTGFVGLNDSFEQVFQATRRFWRFGQTRPVNVHFIASKLEGAVVANLRRKEMDYERMASNMVLHMADLSTRQVRGMARETPDYNPKLPMKLPAFINQYEDA